MSGPRFVQRCKPQSELRAVKEARDTGAHAYMPPTEKVWRKGSRVASIRPIARGYVFTDKHVPSGEYVKNLIGKVKTGELRGLYNQAREMARSVRVARQKKQEPPSYAPGTIVQIMGGPFDKFVGPVVSQKKATIMVAIKMLGSLRAVPCSAWKLRLVNPSVTR